MIFGICVRMIILLMMKCGCVIGMIVKRFVLCLKLFERSLSSRFNRIKMCSSRVILKCYGWNILKRCRRFMNGCRCCWRNILFVRKNWIRYWKMGKFCRWIIICWWWWWKRIMKWCWKSWNSLVCCNLFVGFFCFLVFLCFG